MGRCKGKIMGRAGTMSRLSHNTTDRMSKENDVLVVN
jgi:hypothetical protein